MGLRVKNFNIVGVHRGEGGEGKERRREERGKKDGGGVFEWVGARGWEGIFVAT